MPPDPPPTKEEKIELFMKLRRRVGFLQFYIGRHGVISLLEALKIKKGDIPPSVDPR
jgi:hypothetical protein